MKKGIKKLLKACGGSREMAERFMNRSGLVGVTDMLFNMEGKFNPEQHEEILNKINDSDFKFYVSGLKTVYKKAKKSKK